ncbi:hypothetical protein [Amycolatopsis australiensis]|uniref:hypothetical protein n=1 Tax=Amycolatopsis australiensis TaxID=546364 RepID=UPI0011613D56|nr:hypothetical protein [Amycolatopsis australiensis]
MRNTKRRFDPDFRAGAGANRGRTGKPVARDPNRVHANRQNDGRSHSGSPAEDKHEELARLRPCAGGVGAYEYLATDAAAPRR